jgi:hypothetical protein
MPDRLTRSRVDPSARSAFLGPRGTRLVEAGGRHANSNPHPRGLDCPQFSAPGLPSRVSCKLSGGQLPALRSARSRISIQARQSAVGPFDGRSSRDREEDQACVPAGRPVTLKMRQGGPRPPEEQRERSFMRKPKGQPLPR